MLEREISALSAGRLAHAVSHAEFPQACELIVSECRRLLGVEAAIIARLNNSWTPVTTPRSVALARFVNDTSINVEFNARVERVIHSGRVLTVVQLSADEGLALVVDGDASGAAESLEPWSLVLALALKSVSAEERARRADRLLLRGYAMARRLSRTTGAEAVAERLVSDVAALLDAERVSLALYSADEECLTIAAAHGYSVASVESVRITPGEWVIGHVYATSRPVIVRDVGALAGAARAGRYRSASFAAIPVVAGNDTIGVLSVTDKRDGSGFERHDVIVLRAIAVWAGIALASAHIESAAGRLAYAATIDPVTGLLNRTAFDIRLHQEIERAKREGGALALLIADIDDFKTINDDCGHQAGDHVLQSVGSAIRSAVRVFDVCARYGGDEFAIVMPNATRASALGCAERIRRRLSEHDGVEDRERPQVTMSIGVAALGPGDSVADLMGRADSCMYQAKRQGKDCVVSEPMTDDPPAPAALTPLPVPDRLLEALDIPAGATDDENENIEYADLPYVLVADGRRERASACRDAIVGSQLGLLIAADSEQARRAIERFGPPALLIVDLTLPPNDGFDLIEMVRADRRRHPPIIAWASSRALREYARARLAGLDVRVLKDAASPDVIRAAIAHVLEPDEDEAPAPVPTEEPERAREWIAGVSERARRLCGTAGVAVYMRAPGETRFRASYAWISDDVMPQSPVHLPRAFEHITQTGETMVWNDIAPENGRPSASAPDQVRGLAGVPITSDGDVVGALCVFDARPFQIEPEQLAGLRALATDPYDADEVARPDAVAVFRDRVTDRRLTHEPSNNEGAPGSLVDWPPTLLERRGGEFAVARELARARRQGHPLSIILFETASTEPAVGEHEALTSVSDTLLRAIRQSDLPIRWSDEELLVVLPGLFNRQARAVAERVRAALQAGARHRVAISGGVAEIDAEERFGDVVGRARDRVALARSRGHNRVL